MKTVNKTRRRKKKARRLSKPVQLAEPVDTTLALRYMGAGELACAESDGKRVDILILPDGETVTS